MVDLNGTFKYSKIINIENPENEHLTIFPNPTSDYFSISKITNPEKIQIIDLNGKIIKDFQFHPSNKYSIKDLTAGIYILKIGEIFKRILIE